MSLLEERGRGSETDYVLGTHLGWDAFDVVRWRGVEALDALFHYDIVLVREVERGPIDVDSLIDRGATFCIASAARWRVVHGVVSESELVDQTATRFIYRTVVVPHLARARHRARCRTFVEQSLEQIVSAVLENRAPKHPQGLRGLALLASEPTPPTATPSFDAFREPVPFYRWALLDAERAKVPRRFVVQYNESDFDFASRLLE
ncbi:MAG TPA: contractile injection system protein, VgrG/Pvc8 family, partial [Polyangiaceae bacterium]|nr:contractile injection system protein, VgrG/Pvc8 family [Polyangiaceae bacterium]